MNESATLDVLVFERLTNDPLAEEALATLLREKNKQMDLNVLLRDHAQKKIDDPKELELREGVDRVLALYSLIEIGLYARAIPSKLPQKLASPALDVLTPEPLARYYEKHYPLQLVTRFRNRLRSKDAAFVSDADQSQASRLYATFLDIDRNIADDEDVQTLQWMLDDMWWKGVGFPDLVEVCRQPRGFALALAGEKGVPKPVVQAARGLLEYLDFITRFDELLARAAPVGNLTEYLWLYYAYWFKQIGDKFSERLTSVFTTVGGWPMPGGRTPDMSLLAAAVGRLTSGPQAYWRRETSIRHQGD